MVLEMSRYSWLIGDNRSGWATAVAPKDYDELELWDLIESLEDAGDWPSLCLSFSDGELSDYPPCNVLSRLCSQRLVELLRPIVGDDVIWLPVTITRNNESLSYFYMHLPTCPNVIDEEKSTYAGGRILTPHISLKKAEGFSVFGLRKLSPDVIIRANIREAIEQSDCNGMAFEDVPTS